jgi:hypothetical protein
MAQQTLPMWSYPLPAGVNTLGYELLPAVTVDTNQSKMSLAIKPTQDIYYVPAMATTEVSGVSLSVAANCSAVQSALNSEATIARVADSVISQLNVFQAQYDKALPTVAKLQDDCNTLTAEFEGKRAEITEAQTVLVTKSGDLTAKRTELQTCNLITPGQCTELQSEVTSLISEIQGLSTKVSGFQTALGPLAGKKAQTCSAYDSANRSLLSLLASIVAAKAQLDTLDSGVSSKVSSFGEEFGGTATAVVSSRSKKQYDELAAANPGYRFLPVRIQESRFTFAPAVYSVEARKIKKATVLGVALAGAEPKEGLPGESMMSIVNAAGSVGLTVSLSRLGACSSEYRGTAAFNISFKSYSYLNGEVKYNKWQTYTRMEETQKKGGLFSNKVVHKLVEDMKAGDGYQFVLLDPSGTIDAETMRSNMQGAMADRVLKMWGDIKAVETGGTMGVPALGPNGAMVAADGLSKCPHLYCQIGSYGLKTLNAIFGKEVTREEVQKSWDVESKESFTYTQAYDTSRTLATEVVIR